MASGYMGFGRQSVPGPTTAPTVFIPFNDEPGGTITVERWWKEMCDRYGQEAWDPDAFCMTSPAELRTRCNRFKAEYGTAEVEVDLPDWY